MTRAQELREDNARISAILSSKDDEIERLRAALKRIASTEGYYWMYQRIAREALKE